MRVLLITPLPPAVGGIASWSVEYLKWCIKHNIEVDTVNTSVTGKRLEDFNKINYLDEVKRNLHIVKEAKNNIKKYRYDVIHINTSCSPKGLIRDYLIAKTAHKKNIKVVIHCRCNVEDWVKGKLGVTMYKKLLQHTNQVITLNSNSKAFLKNNFDVESIILPNFIKAISSKHCVINEKITNVLFVGHLLLDKGVREILETAKMLPKYQFDLIGNVSVEVKRLEKPNNVNYLGEISKEEVIDEMAKHDVFLFPSYTEGFPNVITEAMSVGLPIIATDVGSIPDMIGNGLGQIVRVKNVDDIVKAFDNIKGKSVRENISQKTIQKVKEEYLIDSVMPELIRRYEELIK